jgi:hypothetical protein
MNTKVPQVIDVLMKYGSFARPLVNWALSNDKLNSAWKEYFKAIRYDWQKEYTLELKCIERGIKNVEVTRRLSTCSCPWNSLYFKTLKSQKEIDCTSS